MSESPSPRPSTEPSPSSSTESPSPPLRAVGYTRVSTEDQESRSNDDRARITAACVAYGYQLVEFIEDVDVSGQLALADRPNGRRVHELIESKKRWADVLVVTNLDRLTRDGTDGSALIDRLTPNDRRRHAPLVLMSLDNHVDLTTPDGRLFARMKVAIAAWERETIGQRTKKSLAYRRSVGRTFGPAPYGWVNGPESTLVPDAAEQRIITDMRRWRADGVNDNAIATRLNDTGVPGKRGGQGGWQANTVYRILRIAAQVGSSPPAPVDPDDGLPD